MKSRTYGCKKFYNIGPWVDFGVSLTVFCKLDLFMAMQQILHILIKWSSLQKRVSKSTPKKFIEIDPW